MGSAKSTMMRVQGRDSDQGTRGRYSVSNQDEADCAEEQIVADICAQDELQDGQMKEFTIGNDSEKILLVKDNGVYSAIGTKCTHYGAPLIKGTLANGKVICPWHGACFNSCSGDIEDFPGLDSLPKFKLNVEDGRVKVTANKSDLKSKKRIRKAKDKIGSSDQVILIVGGGGAGAACAEELRCQGFVGKVIMATQENYIPYDRPKLSKFLNKPGEELALRSQQFYKDLDIDVQLKKKAISLDTKEKQVKFDDDSIINYHKLILATGGKPREHAAPGNDLKNVCYLRSPDDGNYIAKVAQHKKVVIIGNSFIAMEVASYLKDKAESVSIVARNDVPFKYSFGPQIGAYMQNMLEEKNVKFHNKCTVEEFIGEDGALTSIKLNDGTVLEADVCVIGIGVVPNTDFIKDSGIEMDNNVVVVDEYLKTNVDDVYAAGDIVSFPLAAYETNVNIGHWQLASYHGKTAACNAIGKNTKLDTVPFFWCMLSGKSIRFCGYNNGYTDQVIDGDVQQFNAAVYYIKDEIVVGVATMNRDPICAQFSGFMRSGKKLTADQVRNNPKDWMK